MNTKARRKDTSPVRGHNGVEAGTGAGSPSLLVVQSTKAPHSQRRVPRFDSWAGNYTLNVTTKTLAQSIK